MRQRGFLGFGLAQLIIYGAIAAAVIGAVWGAISWLEGRGYDKAVAVWKPKYEAMEAEKTRLEGEKASWKLASERCSASIIEARNIAAARDAAARAEIARAKAEAAKREQRLAELALEAANPPTGATCESALIAVTERL